MNEDWQGRTLVVVPTYMRNDHDIGMTLKCINDLSFTVPYDSVIMICDDSSPHKDGMLAIKQRLLGLKQWWSVYESPVNYGFSTNVNHGLRTALENDMHAILVNADVTFPSSVSTDWFTRMHDHDDWVVGAKLLYPNHLIQHAGIYFSVITRTFDHLYRFGPPDLKAANFPRHCPVTGALQFISNECLHEVGLYDENFKMGWEDVDYCLRVFEYGEKCLYDPTVVAVHHESAFRGVQDEKIKQWTLNSWKLLNNKHAGTSFAQYIPNLIGRDPLEGAINV